MNNTFDPTKFGATPVDTQASGGFNPSQFGATPYDPGSSDINKSSALLGLTTAANEKLINPVDPESVNNPDKIGALADNAVQKKQEADQLASEATVPNAIKSGVKDFANGTVRAIGSALRSPIDIVRGLFGKAPMNDQIGQFNAPSVPTVQSQASTDAGQVFDQKMTPEQATLNAVGGALNMANILGVEDLAKGATNLAEKAAGSKTGQAIAKGATDFLAKRGETKATDILKATEDTMTKSERLQAIDEGRLQPTKLGGKEFTASPTEERAGQILGNKLTGNPVKDVGVIKDEIATRGQEAESYLAKNKQPISNKEDFDMFDKERKQATKYLTEPEMKAFDEQVKMFSKQLPGRGGYNTENYYKALKEYEANVADKLPRGKEALLDPTGIANAKIRGASTIRKVVRDMIGEKNPEFKGKMFDLASLYDVKGTMLTKADKLSGNILTRTGTKIIKNPVVQATGAIEGGKKILTGHF